ncbi:uncharacterized protein PRCAT00004654001 [Priceomyces carsonii]|uniref:uncharacterized protein n=1 Tax=Priceomyces carsonii TaxID=28549 RepID=UPI002ED7E355|nr:unnamed protein product [Priceomyces carsonii]
MSYLQGEFTKESADDYESKDNSLSQTSSRAPIITTATISSTASHQHQQEQEMLSGFTIPKPPVSTQQSSAAAEKDNGNGAPSGQSDAPRTLWMGDLDPWLDENGIADLWWQVLKKKVTVKIFKPKSLKPDMNYQGLSHSGYCFVEFESFEDAQQALALNGQLLPDIAMPSQQQFPNNPDNQKKYFRLNWASGATLSAPIVQTPEYSLFVGDLSASTTEAHLLAFFQENFPTSIKTVRVMTDPVSGKSRCFGFVRFTDELERQRALVEMNGAWFGGRPLRVALATPRNNKPRYSNQGNVNYYTPDQGQHPDLLYLPHPPPGMGSPYGFYGSPQMPLPMGIPSNDLQGSEKNIDSPMKLNMGMHPLQGQAYVDPNNTTVFVGGLSSEVTEQTLFTLFKPFGIIQQIKIPPGKNCGFIKYSNREEAEEAIAAMQGFIIGGNRVRLSWGRVSVNNRKYQQQQQAAQAAQLQAAAAVLSMGLDPALAAAGAYPPLPGQLGGMHHMGLPPSYPPTGVPSNDDKDPESVSSEGLKFNEDMNPMAPQFYMPIHPQEYGLSSPDDLSNAIGNMSINDVSRGNGELLPRAPPDNYVNPGLFVPPMFNGHFPQDMRFQQFIPQQEMLPGEPIREEGAKNYTSEGEEKDSEERSDKR